MHGFHCAVSSVRGIPSYGTPSYGIPSCGTVPILLAAVACRAIRSSRSAQIHVLDSADGEGLAPGTGSVAHIEGTESWPMRIHPRPGEFTPEIEQAARHLNRLIWPVESKLG